MAVRYGIGPGGALYMTDGAAIYQKDPSGEGGWVTVQQLTPVGWQPALPKSWQPAELPALTPVQPVQPNQGLGMVTPQVPPGALNPAIPNLPPAETPVMAPFPFPKSWQPAELPALTPVQPVQPNQGLGTVPQTLADALGAGKVGMAPQAPGALNPAIPNLPPAEMPVMAPGWDSQLPPGLRPGGGWAGGRLTGRQLDPRSTLAALQSNSPLIPLLSGISSMQGLDPEAMWGEFRSFLPKGGPNPLSSFY